MSKPLGPAALAVALLIVVVIWKIPARAQSAQVEQIPGVSSASCHPGTGARPWTNANQTPQCRALEVIAQMTHQEKLQFIGGFFGGSVKRLGIVTPPGHDGPNGVAGGGIFPGRLPPLSLNVTAFPTVITLAATWDRSLAQEFGEVVGEEFAGKGMGSVLGPTVNILRTWHWGRSAETFGEDPYLASQMVVPEIRGIQSKGVVAVVKHFVANDQEYGRVGVAPNHAGVDERITQKALHEIYLPAFKAAVQRAHVGGVMCAYDQVNGEFSCNNAWLLGELRHWGFDGYIVPDAVFAQRSVLAAAKAGVDGVSPAQQLDALIRSGKLPASILDKMVFDELTPRFRLGIYDHPPSGNANADVATPAHAKVARQIAEEGAVLLKNEGNVLPLTSRIKSIAVIGDDAGAGAVVMETGSAHVNVMHVSVPLDAIRARAGKSAEVTYARGTLGVGPLPPVPSDVLTPSGTGAAGHGLLANYYASGDWTGTPVATRVDPTIDFSSAPLPQLQPAPGGRGGRGARGARGGRGTRGGRGARGGRGGGVASRGWSATWVGSLTPSVTGDYRFSLTCGGTAQLYVGDKAVVTVMRADFPRTSQGMIHLLANHPVPIEMKYSSASNLLGRALKMGWQPPDPAMLSAAVNAARRANVAIVFAGKEMGEGHDDMTLQLPGDQDKLIEAVARANPRTVVVLNTANPVAMPWLGQVKTVIEAWYPGQEDGAAIASVLFGDVDPSGRLPVTFPRDPLQGPATNFMEYPGDGYTANFDEGVLVGYRWYDAKGQTPLFPFGFGLSYTTFKYSQFHLSGTGAKRTASVRITNTGARAGAEVVQLYLRFPPAAGEPPRQLKGFERVELAPRQSKSVVFSLGRNSLSAWDPESQSWRTYNGPYTVEIASSSSDIRERGSFTLGPGPGQANASAKGMGMR